MLSLFTEKPKVPLASQVLSEFLRSIENVDSMQKHNPQKDTGTQTQLLIWLI